MRSFTSIVLLLSALAGESHAHYIFQQFSLGATKFPVYQYIRKNTNMNSPVTVLTSTDLRCNQGGLVGAPDTLPVKAGDSFTWTADQTVYHKGPLSMYMAKAPGKAADFDGSGQVWFKILDLGPVFKSTQGEPDWPQSLTYSYKIPLGISNGEYLLRVEQIGLHNPGSPPQFYISCAQLIVTGGSNGKPTPLVSIPGHITGTEPGYTANIYANFHNFTTPGPEVWAAQNQVVAAPQQTTSSPPPPPSTSSTYVAPPTTLTTKITTSSPPPPPPTTSSTSSSSTSTSSWKTTSTSSSSSWLPTTCASALTVYFPSYTTAYVTAVSTVALPASTVTLPASTITLPGGTLTLPGLTLSAPTVTLPGPTITISPTNAPATSQVTVYFPSYITIYSTKTLFSTTTAALPASTLTLPASSITIPGPTVTLPAVVSTIISTLPPSTTTVSLPGTITTITLGATTNTIYFPSYIVSTVLSTIYATTTISSISVSPLTVYFPSTVLTTLFATTTKTETQTTTSISTLTITETQPVSTTTIEGPTLTIELPVTVNAPQASPAIIANHYEQCGGTTYTKGATTCADQWNCKVMNDYYWQCVPN